MIRKLVTDDRSRIWTFVFLAASISLAVFTVYDHALIKLGKTWLLGEEMHRLDIFLKGESVNPWQYRVLSNFIVIELIKLTRSLGLMTPEFRSLVFFRLIQNILIFFLSSLYWRELKIRRLHILMGLAILAWMFQNSNYRSGLSFSTWTDISFFLMGALIILRQQYMWILPLMAMAGLNRETSGLIPFMVLSSVWFPRWDSKTARRAVIIAALGLLIYSTEFFLLREIYGSIPALGAFGHSVGFDLLKHSLSDRKHIVLLFSAISYLPLLAIFYWRRWPSILHRFFWATVPIWLTVNSLFAFIVEARVLMVPVVIVFLPAALFVIQNEQADQNFESPAVTEKSI